MLLKNEIKWKKNASLTNPNSKFIFDCLFILLLEQWKKMIKNELINEMYKMKSVIAFFSCHCFG